MAELTTSELADIIGHDPFPGKEELLRWLAANGAVTVSRPDIENERLWTAADSRRNWEIRSWSTERAGIEKGGLEDGISALRELEQANPRARVGIISAKAGGVVWIVLLTEGLPICAFWVRRRTGHEG